MANIKSSAKRAGTNDIKNARNVARKTEIKTATKKVLTALANNNIAEAKDLLKLAEAKIARACGKGVLQKNTASRKISRLAVQVAAAAR